MISGDLERRLEIETDKNLQIHITGKLYFWQIILGKGQVMSCHFGPNCIFLLEDP